MYSSLLTAVDSTAHVHLVVGVGSALASARCARSLEVGARVKVVGCSNGTAGSSFNESRSGSDHASGSTAEAQAQSLPISISRFVDSGKVDWIARDFEESDLTTLGREDVDGVVDAVFVTFRGAAARRISILCRRLRIPVNVTDAPELCSFTLLSAHRDGPLQIGVTTSGRGCKLASRIRREIAGFLPAGTGDAVERLGGLRRRVREEDAVAAAAAAVNADGTENHLDMCQDKPGSAIANSSHVGSGINGDDDNDDETGQSANLNKLVQEDDVETSKTRRIRWLSQICEYWPLQRLVAVSDSEINDLLKAYVAGTSRGIDREPHNTRMLPPSAQSSLSAVDEESSKHTSVPVSAHQQSPVVNHDGLSRDLNISNTFQKGTIILAGSGPGHPSLLTLAAHEAIQKADLILADKLVPAPILDLIPRRTRVHIARKFPGNADAAQDELLALGLAELKSTLSTSTSTATSIHSTGKTVLRLKQGDPFLFGRGAEEVAFFRSHGYNPIVIPGLSSALSAPLFASIPPTHRGVADHVLLCTGTGRRGAVPSPPSFRPGRTVIFLMALHRIKGLVESLMSGDGHQEHGVKGVDERHEDDGITSIPFANGANASALPTSSPLSTKQPWQPWPLATPCAVIERASCPDQRVIRTTLLYVCDAIEEQGSRPPGLLVVGGCCDVLERLEQKHGNAEKKRKRTTAAEDMNGAESGGSVIGSDGSVQNGRTGLHMEQGMERDADLDMEKWTVEEGYRNLDWVSASMTSR